jgi:hypothetical protein
MTHLDIWFDGPASQFKNCYIAEFLQHLCGNMFHRVDAIDWHFFATSHGKGPCDAVGGSVKRSGVARGGHWAMAPPFG